jgi:glucose/arabinose dehydrogenase
VARRAVAAGLLASALLVAPAHALRLEPVVGTPGEYDDNTRVVDLVGVPGRMLAVQQAGFIHVIRDDRLLERPYLDLRDRVLLLGHRGLLSVAPAPDYRQTRLVYVLYIDRDGDIIVASFRGSRRNPNRALPRSRRTVLRIGLPVSREGVDPRALHVAGFMRFGPDHLLYIAVGDGGQGYGDADADREVAQDPNSLLGKLLRIDPTRRTGRRRYGIPPGNPFRGRATGRGEVFSYGLRNPWRFAFDGRAISIADPGAEDREEVNLLPRRRARGAFFGWPYYEGRLQRRAGPQGVLPAFDYPHDLLDLQCGAGVIGGYVDREHALGLYGRYVYGDFCFRELRSFDPSDPYGTDRLELELPSHINSINPVRGQMYVLLEGGAVMRVTP